MIFLLSTEKKNIKKKGRREERKDRKGKTKGREDVVF